ncbi:MAG: hypothetical protein ACYDC9_10595 [Dermatophilaceae bacterium]
MRDRWPAWQARWVLPLCRGWCALFVPVAVVVGSVVAGLVALGPVAAAGVPPDPAAVLSTEHTILPVPAGTMAEPTVAIDPHNPRRMAVAADPYLEPTRIQISVSEDAGQSWSASMTVVPPGESKSYDPQLGYAADGSLLVTGGASPDTRSGCQRDSKIFIAALHGNQFSYHVLATASAGALLDRPTLLATPAREQQQLVAWTASPGPGAECSLRPVRSTTQVGLLTPQLGLRTVVTLPPVAQAPFGSALAISGEGVLGLAVAGRDGSDGVTVGVYQSADGTHWRFSRAGSARAEPDELAGLGGAVLSMPSIAGLPHGFALAWTDTTQGTERTRIARNDTGGWEQVAAPPAQGTRLLPTLAVADQALVLIQAGLSPAGLTFYTWAQLGPVWFSLATDTGGSASDMQELGELLGLAVSADGSRVTAVPVELAGSSALLVRTQTPPPVTTSVPAPPGRRPDAVTAQPQPGGRHTGTKVLVGLGAGFLLLLAVSGARARRRHRRHRHRR